MGSMTTAELLDSRMARLEGAYEQIDKRLATVEGRLETLEQRVDAGFNRLDAKIDRLDAKIDGVRSSLDAKIDRIMWLVLVWTFLVGVIITILANRVN